MEENQEKCNSDISNQNTADSSKSLIPKSRLEAAGYKLVLPVAAPPNNSNSRTTPPDNSPIFADLEVSNMPKMTNFGQSNVVTSPVGNYSHPDIIPPVRPETLYPQMQNPSNPVVPSSQNPSSSSSTAPKNGQKRSRWLLCYPTSKADTSESPSSPSDTESNLSTPSPTDHGFRIPNSYSNERPTSLPVALLNSIRNSNGNSTKRLFKLLYSNSWEQRSQRNKSFSNSNFSKFFQV